MAAIRLTLLRVAFLIALMGCMVCGVLLFTRQTAYGFTPTYAAAVPPDASPHYGSMQPPESVRRRFLAAIPAEIQAAPHGLGQLIRLRQWVRGLVPSVSTDQVAARDPVTILEEVTREHKSVICGDLGTLMTYSARSLGYPARQIYLVEEYTHRTLNSHVTTEVWLDSLGKWVVMDATLNAYFTDPAGHPLSAAEIHDAYYITHTPVEAVRDGSTTEPSPDSYDPPLSHLYHYVGYYFPGLVTAARWSKPLIYLFQQHGVAVLEAPYGNAGLYRLTLGVVICSAALGLLYLFLLLRPVGAGDRAPVSRPEGTGTSLSPSGRRWCRRALARKLAVPTTSVVTL